MNAKHTPGPWRVDRLDGNGQSVVAAEHIEVATCWHHCVESIEREMQANARLIAAAPDLLEALLAVLPHCGVGYSGKQQYAIKEKARAAIAKATGETR